MYFLNISIGNSLFKEPFSYHDKCLPVGLEEVTIDGASPPRSHHGNLKRPHKLTVFLQKMEPVALVDGLAKKLALRIDARSADAVDGNLANNGCRENEVE